MRKAVITRAVCALLLVATVSTGLARAQTTMPAFGNTTVEIEAGMRVHRLKVQLAASPRQLSYGLMYRRELAPWDGMLFDFGAPQIAQIWMKNTYIPLDILFIRADGTIESIAEGVPESLAVMPSRGPVRGVLELPRGTAKRLDIKPGDTVRHPIFGRAIGRRP